VYSSKFTHEAVENIKRLPKNVKNALKKGFEKKIHVDPIGCSEPLTGLLEGFRSFHFESYRVVYKVIEDIRVVAVVTIGKKDKSHQTDLYKRLEALAKAGKLAKAVLETYRSITP
jgi:mRNA-degrading endonuclease RelE of RelBE toxin-antitoxin system